MKRLSIAFGVSVLLLSGCTIRLADFTVVSIKNSNVPAKSIGTRVTGEHCVFSWIGVSWFGTEPNLKEAFGQAMNNAGPEYDALVDAVVYRKNGIWKNCYEVRGIGISTKTAKVATDKK